MLYQFKKETLIPDTEHLDVFTFTRDCREYILKITEYESEPVELMNTRISQQLFSEYLWKNGLPAARPLRSIKGYLVSVIHYGERWYLCYATRKIRGKRFTEHQNKERADLIYYEWGKYLGRIHQVSQNCNIQIKRKSSLCVNMTNFQCPEFSGILEYARQLQKKSNHIEREKTTYGLIHNDFHLGNIAVNKHITGFFDFDEAHNNWFVQDLAVVFLEMIYDRIIYDRKTYLNFCARFINGYMKAKCMSENIITQIPYFINLKYISDIIHAINTYKKIISLCFDGTLSKLSTDQKTFIKNIYNKIQRGKDFFPFELKF